MKTILLALALTLVPGGFVYGPGMKPCGAGGSVCGQMASAGAKCPPIGRPTDANTLLMFRANEPLINNPLIDEISGQSFDPLIASLPSVPGQVDTARDFTAGGYFHASAGAPPWDAVEAKIALGQVTVEAVAFLTSYNPSYSDIFEDAFFSSNRSYFGLYIDPSGHPFVQTYSGGFVHVQATGVVPLNVATDVEVSYNDNGLGSVSVLIYINGVLDTSGTLTPATPAVFPLAMCIGSSPACGGGQNDVFGWLDEIKVEGVVMTPAQIASDVCAVGLLAQ